MKTLIGDKKFYTTILMIAIPIMIQNGITNFVSMLDNIMVGQIGTNEMSGVAIVNQMMLVFNITIFGAVSGAGIFCAQYFGCKDYEGVRNSFRYKLMICAGVFLLAMMIFLLKGKAIISLFLSETGNAADIEATLSYAWQYLLIMLIGLPPFVLEQAYSSTLRETNETMLPMKAGVVAVFVNLILNYLLIFGKFGFPVWGVCGAAVATVVSRYVQTAIVMIWTFRHRMGEGDDSEHFLRGLYSSFRVPVHIAGRITLKATPLLVNECLWAVGMSGLVQCYSVRGLDVVAGLNISNTIMNVFNVVYLALGSAIAIILGQLLGAGKMEEAKDKAIKLIFFSFVSCLAMSGIMIMCSSVFPEIYNTTDRVKELGKWFIQITAILMPVSATVNASYFTLRSGGKTGITFLFDSVFVWTVMLPVAFALSRFTNLPAVPLYFCCQSLDLIKCFIGLTLVKKGIWIENLT